MNEDYRTIQIRHKAASTDLELKKASGIHEVSCCKDGRQDLSLHTVTVPRCLHFQVLLSRGKGDKSEFPLPV